MSSILAIGVPPSPISVIFDSSGADSYAVSLADLNGDKTLDIIIGNSESPNFVYLNEENGRKWKGYMLSEESFDTYDIITADLNMDGLPDIIEANSDEINRYYLNRKKK